MEERKVIEGSQHGKFWAQKMMMDQVNDKNGALGISCQLEKWPVYFGVNFSLNYKL